jgi:hypothetical protein
MIAEEAYRLFSRSRAQFVDDGLHMFPDRGGLDHERNADVGCGPAAHEQTGHLAFTLG